MDGAFTAGDEANEPPPAPVIGGDASKKPFGLSVKSRSQQFCTLSGAHPSGLRGLAVTAAASVFVCLLSSSPARSPGDISIKLLFGSEATQTHLELVMDFASVKASDAVLIVPTGYS